MRDLIGTILSVLVLWTLLSVVVAVRWYRRRFYKCETVSLKKGRTD